MNTHSIHRWLLLIALLLAPGFRLAAQTSPYVIPFQGRLTNQQGVAYSSGQYTIVFNIYSQSIGGTTQWTERHEKVGVTNGMISVFLGSITPLPTTTGNPPVAFFSTTRYLGITVDADDNAATADPEMVPRQMIIPAFHAKNADKMASQFGSFDWSVLFGAGIDPGTNNVALSKIPTLTVDKLPDNIPASKLENGAALANLNANGVSGVATGGIVLSANANDTALIAAGYTKLGAGQFGEGWKPKRGAYLSTRSQMLSVWTGAKLIVWGGKNAPGTTLSDGGVYDLATDLWSGTTETNEPSARRIGNAAWTGSEMILWGGIDPGGNTLNTGSVYDPSTNTWTTLPACPISARYLNVSVWTGNELILWGGVGSTGVAPALGDGATLKKVTGTWTWQVMSTTNAPTARTEILRMAAWTGSEMIVWGGHSGGAGGSAVASGARYNPSTNTWTPMTNTGAPSARWAGTVVWTGTEAIVWGGLSGSGYQATGGRYNPTTDTWTLMSTTGQAAPRRSDIGGAFWTGSQFLVWGGYDGSYRSDGGLYDPVNDTWRQIPYMGVGGRSEFASAWTGSEMLIYGGGDSGGPTDELWSYTPPRTLYLYQRNAP